MTAIAFQTKLKSDTVHLPDVDKLIGKDVIITVVEIDNEKNTSTKKVWHFLGAANLNGELDSVNIRDFAHE